MVPFFPDAGGGVQGGVVGVGCSIVTTGKECKGVCTHNEDHKKHQVMTN